jgi:hypothetical protein
MKPNFFVTYDIVSDESAENGDTESAGFIVPGNWHYELPADMRGANAGAFKAEHAMTLREAIRLVGCLEDTSGGRWYTEADARQDYATGSWETRALHLPDNVTPASARRIARVLKAERLL